MKIIEKDGLKVLQAAKNKKIRAINDVYKEAYTDENGIEFEEHFPYYTDTIYLAKNFNEEDVDKYYVEEDGE